MKNVWKIFQRDMMRVRNKSLRWLSLLVSVSFPACMRGSILQPAGIRIPTPEILRWLWPAWMKDMREV